MVKDLKNIFDLDGKVAVVTGAGSGLGRAIAEGYAQYGANIALIDINEKDLAEVESRIKDAGGSATAFKCNVASSQNVRDVIFEVIKKFGYIDILVNNAGIGRRAYAECMTDEDWDAVLDINLKGAFLLCREVGKEMIKRGCGGRIINMASITGLVGVETGNANYSASKGGIIAMTRCLAIEWAKYNILVNAIAPSHTRTPLIEKLIMEKPDTGKYFLNNIPLGRLGESEDIVGPAIFLASDASRFITGHTLVVDGGHTAK